MSAVREAFYEAFWVLPNAPLPVAGDLRSDADGEPLPEPVITKRKELRRVLAELDLTQTEPIQEAIGCCDLYVRSLRAARVVSEPEGESTWNSSITAQATAIPLAFDEPMTLVLEALLLVNLGTCLAQKRTLDCISEAAHSFCQAAGLVEFIITLQEDICSSLQTDVPVELPELAPRILRALADMAVAMAQQLAIVKSMLFREAATPCTASALQKLHAGCHHAFESFETAVVRCCYSARPKRNGCSTLLGFSTVFGRIHRSLVLQLGGEIAFASSSTGKAVAFASAALRHLQERQSMREIGLPPLDGDGGMFQQHSALAPRVETQRLALQQLVASWTKDNDTIYFEPVPSEETILSEDIARVLIMKATEHHANTRLGSVRMFREVSSKVDDTDLVMKLDSSQTDKGDADGEGDEDGHSEAEDKEKDDASEPPADTEVFSRSVRDERNADDVAKVQTVSAVEPRVLEERASAPDVSTSTSSTTRHAKSLASPRPVELPASTGPPQASPFTTGRSARRMATRVQPQKSMTTRTLLGNIGKQDSLITLQQSEEELRKVVTDEALFRMKRTLLGGVEVYRLVKEKWKKEVLRVHDDHVVLLRKKAIAILSKQIKFPWQSVHAFQHEMQPTNQVLQLLAPPGRRMTSILLIARLGDTVEPTEFTFRTPEENALAVAALQRLLQEKRGAASQS